MPWNWIIGTFALAYLLGSIPFGLLLTRLAGLDDVRQIGSGSIGATNVMRTGRKELAILTLLLDAGKGFFAVWLARYLYASDFAFIAGLLAVIGHIFPVWLRFKGGKGVATAIGVFFALNWLLGLSIIGMWLMTFAFTRFSSLSSIMSFGYAPIAACMLGDDSSAMLAFSLVAIIAFTHRDNIQRLLRGTEHGFRRKKA